MGTSVVDARDDRLAAANGETIEKKSPQTPVRKSPRKRDHSEQRLVKASFNLPVEELAALKELAERRQTSATQVLREALRTELYVQQLVDSGATLIAKIGRRSREIVFSHMTA